MDKQESKIIRIFERLKKSLLKGSNSVKLLFLLLSVFLWFLIKLSKEGYTSEFSFPVEYINVPADKRLINAPTSNIIVRVRSHGFDLLKQKLRSLRPVVVDLGNNLRTERGRYFWDTNGKRNLIDIGFDDNTEILSVLPDTVFFDFNALKTKKVGVYLRYERLYSNFRTFYNEPQIVPSFIEVSGTLSEVQQIDSVFTGILELNAEEDTVSYNVKLDLPENTNLEFSQEYVKVKLRYASLTEGESEQKVQVLNLPEGFKLNVFPATVKVKYQVAVEDFELAQESEFDVYVDFEDLKGREDVKFLSAKLKSSPSFLKRVSMEPRQLEFILIKE